MLRQSSVSARTRSSPWARLRPWLWRRRRQPNARRWRRRSAGAAGRVCPATSSSRGTGLPCVAPAPSAQLRA